MTVKQLINKLKKYPENATVIIENDSSFEDGFYKATEATCYEDDGEVLIGSDYKRKA